MKLAKLNPCQIKSFYSTALIKVDSDKGWRQSKMVINSTSMPSPRRHTPEPLVIHNIQKIACNMDYKEENGLEIMFEVHLEQGTGTLVESWGLKPAMVTNGHDNKIMA